MKSGTSNTSEKSAELQRIYQARFDGRQEYRKKVWSVLIRDYFQKLIRPEDAVLDLGAGYCEFVNQITCDKKYALDLNPDTVRFANADVQVIPQDCTQLWPLSDSLDAVFTSNFFEHLPDKQMLVNVLSEARRCLKPGGRIIAMGPNITYCGDAYWEVIDHRLALSEKTLSETFMHAGLTVEKCIDKFMPFTMSEGPHYPIFFVSAYLRLPFAWRIFGKQFLVIAKKS